MPLDVQKLRRVREEQELTQDAAARKAGFDSRQAWSNIESGRQASISITTLDRIAKALGVKPAELLK